MVSLRCIALIAILASTPLQAQDADLQEYDPLAEAASIVNAHVVSTTTGCSVPMPVAWNAPPWQQQAAMRRRAFFEQCLERAYTREYDRLEQLSYRVDDIRAGYPDLDWSNVEFALEMKWTELDQVESKLAIQQQWADTAVTILDTFTGPGAPLDSSPLNPARNPYGYSSYSGYRPDSSVSARGVR